MSRIVRAALTETANAYTDMPERIEDVDRLAGHLDDVRDANLAHHAELVAAAAGSGVAVLCLGELFAGPYFALHTHPLWRELAEDAASGPSITAMRSLARTHGIILIAPIYELEADTGRRFNTAVVISETGAILGRYRKTHIPEGRNERAAFHETAYYERGNDDPPFPVFNTSVGRLGVATCYDRHFEGVMRSLARAGAELVFSPAVTFGAQSQRLWKQEFAVDAARHRIYIGGSNRRGAERPWNVEFFGASHFVGPNGPVPSLDAPDHLVIADLDLDKLSADSASGWNLPRDARPGIYSP